MLCHSRGFLHRTLLHHALAAGGLGFENDAVDVVDERCLDGAGGIACGDVCRLYVAEEGVCGQVVAPGFIPSCP
ncbi:MAG: hypothetical protein PUH24_02250 [Prevotellaceae bacterium]|nr:hypothetical protein [Prevotella sp.]MDD7257098.1 hypothetical protein [Prevotellaceae bacterium]MDY6130467.1 hypothetical protein [Prevotella sp.]